MAHVSTPEGIETVVRERASGARLRIETCSQYLSFYEREKDRRGRVPQVHPARARPDGGGPRRDVASRRSTGRSTTSRPSHAPSTREQKLAGSIWDVHFGLPGIDTTLSGAPGCGPRRAHRLRTGRGAVTRRRRRGPTACSGPRATLRKALMRTSSSSIQERAWLVRDEDIVSEGRLVTVGGPDPDRRRGRDESSVGGSIARDRGDGSLNRGSGASCPARGRAS